MVRSKFTDPSNHEISSCRLSSKVKITFLLALLTVLLHVKPQLLHGRFIEGDELDKLELGVTTQAETIAILGRLALKARLIPDASITIIRKWRKK